MHKKLIALCVAGLAASATQADIVGATAGVQHWNQSWDGFVQSSSSANDRIDVNDDLKYDEETGISYYVALEHPIPVLPNLRIQRTEIEVSERGTVNATFDNQPFASDVDSTTDLTHTDFTMYYELLDNWVNLDVGLSVRLFDGEITIKDTSGSQEGSVDVDVPVPMLYANARFDLPFSGFYAQAVGNMLSVGDNSITDMSVGIGFEATIFSLEAGYRSFDLKLEDDEDEADLTIDGLYVGVNIDI
ncbi:TIGR04219 family outer membrane beta-barrel protein [Spongiibacter sp. KMU-158]|uniref:TIGR04219 family outer membrane beta-barrel protein n=1 Tax=Spongiibacter pelagi TaxID=2760804 RepID=A0A927C5A8_9GAMM|nr:TIGR04219 family outer membrane beta-barrel protein [Spongiibacter pelagi]MBD2860016.1 TIGR04219 family outer membrane beta-barrel protein [Spongiibacter pelagi]